MPLFQQGIPISKRCFDLIFASLCLVVISPILAITSLLMLLFLKPPIFFTQERPGYMGRLFKVYKFRTMTIKHAPTGDLLPDAERLTLLGKIMRAISLDEIPELLNVLRGEMSLVGPRPLLVQYLDRYSPEQARRHEVLPGITGWAQINGRNALTWEDKFKLDVWYVDHWSLWLDMVILLRTICTVIRREGINQPGQATAAEFMGNNLINE